MPSAVRSIAAAFALSLAAVLSGQAAPAHGAAETAEFAAPWGDAEPSERARRAFEKAERLGRMRHWQSFLRRYGDEAGRDLYLDAMAHLGLQKLDRALGAPADAPVAVTREPAEGTGRALEDGTYHAAVREEDTAPRRVNPDLVFEEAKHLALSQRAGEAAELLEGIVETGHSEALYLYGSILYKGDDVPVDRLRAARLYASAARQGHSMAAYDLGRMLERGDGIARDVPAAAAWYEKAAEAGNRRAPNNLATLYFKGEGGLPKDRSIAARWLAEATRMRDPVGTGNYALVLDLGIGVAPDARTAARTAADALKLGDRNTFKRMMGGAERFTEGFRIEFQELLRRSGDYSGPADGIFRATTREAVRALFAKGTG